jgi:hypothetical protein
MALAQSRMEELQTTASTSFPADGTYQDGGSNVLLDGNGRVNTDPTYGIYQRKVSWQKVVDPIGTRELITVTVYWDVLSHSVSVQGVRIP